MNRGNLSRPRTAGIPIDIPVGVITNRVADEHFFDRIKESTLLAKMGSLSSNKDPSFLVRASIGIVSLNTKSLGQTKNQEENSVTWHRQDEAQSGSRNVSLHSQLQTPRHSVMWFYPRQSKTTRIQILTTQTQRSFRFSHEILRACADCFTRTQTKFSLVIMRTWPEISFPTRKKKKEV